MPIPTPLYVRYAKLSITCPPTTGTAVEYQCSVTSAGLTSEGGDITSISTLCPDGSFSESSPRTWSLSVTAVQDVEDDASLMWFLMDNDGEPAEVEWYAKTDGVGTPLGRGYQGTVTLAPPDTVGGGEAGTYATFTAVLPFSGKPVPIDALGAPITFGVSSASAEDKAAREVTREDTREPVPA